MNLRYLLLPGCLDSRFLINRPDLIESVLVTNYQSFHKDRVLRNNRWFLGDGLLTSEGAYWLRQKAADTTGFPS